ncbi:phosphatidylinositol-specific phospholipase c, X domain-containing protein [Hirsutella rhossiliensis]|uniref:Phosphatidylinositol-specific phospholipase c, X domain-containing protein n=1 Tax=Hirsutella rhossiliensis TaxID=111463 RepID=A0A9P8SIN3_9HYPO|nr:phosphatidylinositol-specific phospholipase c, X domain-containing protein [Hirsutella rhossiliensis]KAH0963364.1 phosphatidylinositol-specific phospholipase c, X domain-containing protein [Hirsutella rhossiliensis]
MSQLAVRNLTAHPLELVKVERFESERISTGTLFGNVTGTITGLLNATAHSTHQTHPKGDPVQSDDLALALPPFTTTRTDFDAPDHDGEVLRLTFKTEHRHYETDVPSPSRRSAVMKKLDDGPHDLTVVYVPAAALLAVFSSAALHAWMRELHDDWPLALLSIPGTHNSPTCYKALPSVRCQAVDVPDQLRNGVRFLDVRVSVNPDDDALALVHSAFPISLTGNKYFGDMLDHLYRFIDENPSETIVMSVKREGTGKGTDGQLAKYLKHSYVDKRRDLWWTEPKMPTLGQARGKIVIVRRFGLDDDMRQSCWDGRGWAIDAQQWPDNCEDGTGGDGCCFRIQDFYEVSESQNIDKKVNYSCGQLERAAEQVFALDGMPGHQPDAPVPPLFVNFLTASNFFNAACWPERIAAKVNPAVVEYLCVNHGEEGKGPGQLKVGCAGTGIVVTDWVGANDDWDLVRCVVGMNARLQHTT